MDWIVCDWKVCGVLVAVVALLLPAVYLYYELEVSHNTCDKIKASGHV